LTTIDEQDLKLLARLPVLCYLDLTTESTITAGNINAGDGCFFQKLRYFQNSGMVLFEQPNEEDASISLHMWNGDDAMPFASRKRNDSRKVVPSGVMPNLEVLQFVVPLRALRDNNGDCGSIGLEYLPSLQELRGWIDCEDVPVAESDAEFAALRNACNVHPNHPTLRMYKQNYSGTMRIL
jgi:disease resistance protein RPM1